MLDTSVATASAANSGNPRAHWPAELQASYEAGQFSGVVGSVLVSETDRVRVWHLTIPPGGRCGFHRHVLNYFWTALTDGLARGYFEDGSFVDTKHFQGQTKHMDFGPWASTWCIPWKISARPSCGLRRSNSSIHQMRSWRFRRRFGCHDLDQ